MMPFTYLYAALRREKAMRYASAAERIEPNDEDLAMADQDIDQMTNTQLMQSLALHDAS